MTRKVWYPRLFAWFHRVMQLLTETGGVTGVALGVVAVAVAVVVVVGVPGAEVVVVGAVFAVVVALVALTVALELLLSLPKISRAARKPTTTKSTAMIQLLPLRSMARAR